MKKILLEEENSIQNIAAGVVYSSRQSETEKVPWSRDGLPMVGAWISQLHKRTVALAALQ